MPRGRPRENRAKLTIYVKRATRKLITDSVNPNDAELNTKGKVVDRRFAK